MKNAVLCLFFFCLFVMNSCVNGQDNGILEESADILVLTDGKEGSGKIAEIICEKMGAVMYDMTLSQKEELKFAVKQADYILIGTEKKTEELEFTLKKYFEEKDLAGKPCSIFLLNREEEEEYISEQFVKWYPDALFLPIFTMNLDEKMLEEELGRMNGWLTSVYTYKLNRN